jgi:cephalosporin hydroxylase
MEKAVVDAFTALYFYSEKTWNYSMTKWQGVPLFHTPLDLWVAQEIIHETEPDIIIETGSAFGGSALFFTSCFGGKVMSVDLQGGEMVPMITHPRIEFIKGSSLDEDIIAHLKKICEGKRVMVFLDSDHSAAHVIKEMEIYGPMVTPGCYMWMHDTIIGGNPITDPYTNGDPGPMKAVKDFLARPDCGFIADSSREKYMLTFSPGGWLKRL